MYDIKSKVLKPTATLVIRRRLPAHEVGDWLGTAFDTTARFADEIGGPPFARYRLVKLDPAEFEVEAGFPVTGAQLCADGVEESKLPGGLAAAAWHIGCYSTMEPAYKAITDWLEEHGAMPDGAPWEVYYTDAKEEPDPSAWRTEIVQPYTQQLWD